MFLGKCWFNYDIPTTTRSIVLTPLNLKLLFARYRSISNVSFRVNSVISSLSSIAIWVATCSNISLCLLPISSIDKLGDFCVSISSLLQEREMENTKRKSVTLREIYFHLYIWLSLALTYTYYRCLRTFLSQ
jgi:hypothetical protein